MSNVSVVENNRLLAEFIEMQSTNIGWFDSESVLRLVYTSDNTFDELLFHSSWDWLMPVLKKCYTVGDDTGQWDALFEALSTIEINEVYEAVVNFVQWYNNECEE